MTDVGMENQRKDDRYSLFLLAAMRLGNQGVTLRIKVRNLSPGGMMVECAVHTQSGEQVMVDLRNVGWVSGRVTWVMENRFGVAFDREIDWNAIRQPVTVGEAAPDVYIPRPIGANRPQRGNMRRI